MEQLGLFEPKTDLIDRLCSPQGGQICVYYRPKEYPGSPRAGECTFRIKPKKDITKCKTKTEQKKCRLFNKFDYGYKIPAEITDCPAGKAGRVYFP